jgi:hypothetical protein
LFHAALTNALLCRIPTHSALVKRLVYYFRRFILT